MGTGISIHIGLNSVDPKHYAGWPGTLVACEADADDMTHIAKSQGFKSTQLLTRNATRDAVLGEIGRAAKVLESGDILFLSYSGHGGQVPDTDDEETDGMDETWCLYDGELIDDELYAAWPRFKAGVRILVLSDSCHSGTAVREALALTADPATRALVAPVAAVGDTELRFRAMPLEVALRTYRQNRSFYDSLQVPLQEASKKETQATVRLISGCQDNQTSLDGAFNGLFTGTLLRVWREGAFAGDYAKFHQDILKRMPSTQAPNHFLVGAPNSGFDAQKPFSI